MYNKTTSACLLKQTRVLPFQRALRALCPRSQPEGTAPSGGDHCARRREIVGMGPCKQKQGAPTEVDAPTVK